MLDADLPTIETPRLFLRAALDADAPALFGIYGDPEVVRYWSRPAMAEVSEAHALVDEIHTYFAEKTLFEWMVVRREGGDVIGTCTLATIDVDHLRAEIGFAFSRAVWGAGYATEAVEALLSFAFDELGLLRIEADVDPRNARSLAVLDRLGFVREGYLPERFRVGGGVQDSVLLGLLATRRPTRDAPAANEIRPMRLADRDAVRTLLAQQLAEHDLPTTGDEIAHTIDGLVDRPDRGLVLLADPHGGEGGPIGVAYVAYTWTLEHGGHVAWLEELYVLPDHRGRGWGGRLLEAAMDAARRAGARAMDLEVDTDHARAMRLYERAGFVRLHRSRMQRRL